MNAIEVNFKTEQAARQAYEKAVLSPFTVVLWAKSSSGPSVAVGAEDTTAASLVAWFAANFGGSSFKVII